MSDISDLLVELGADADNAAKLDGHARFGFQQPGGRISPEDVGMLPQGQGQSVPTTWDIGMSPDKDVETPEQFKFGEQLYALDGDSKAQEKFLTEQGFNVFRSKTGSLLFTDPKKPDKIQTVPRALQGAWNRHVLGPMVGAALIPTAPVGGTLARGAAAIARAGGLGRAGVGIVEESANLLGNVGMAAAENVGTDIYEDYLRQEAGLPSQLSGEELGRSAKWGAGVQAAFEGAPLAGRYLKWAFGKDAAAMKAYEEARSRAAGNIAERERRIGVRADKAFETTLRENKRVEDRLARGARQDLRKQQIAAEEKVKQLQRQRESVFGEAVLDEATIAKATEDFGLGAGIRPRYLSGTLEDIEAHGRDLRNGVLDASVKWDEELGRGANKVFAKHTMTDLGDLADLHAVAKNMSTSDPTLGGWLGAIEGMQAKWKQIDLAARKLYGAPFKALDERRQHIIMEGMRQQGVQPDWTVGRALRMRRELVNVAKGSKDPTTRAQALSLVELVDNNLINSGLDDSAPFQQLRNDMMFRREMIDKGFEKEMSKAQDVVSVMATMMKRMKDEPGASLATLRKMKEANPTQFEAIRYHVLDEFFSTESAEKAAGEISKWHPEVLKELLGPTSAGKVGNLLRIRGEMRAANNYIENLLSQPGGEDRLEAAFKRVAESDKGQDLARALSDAQKALQALPDEEEYVKAALMAHKARDPYEAAQWVEKWGRRQAKPLPDPHEAGIDAFVERKSAQDFWTQSYIHMGAAALMSTFGVLPYKVPGLIPTLALAATGKKAMAALFSDRARAEAVVRMWKQPVRNEDDLARRILRTSALYVSQRLEEQPSTQKATPEDLQNFLEKQGVSKKDPEIEAESHVGRMRQGETPDLTKDLQNGKVRAGDIPRLLAKGAIDPEIEQLNRAPLDKQIMAMARSGSKKISEAVQANMERELQKLPPEERERLIKHFETVYQQVVGGISGRNR